VTKSVRVLIVDDQPRARQSLKALLGTLPRLTEIREAADGREAVRSAEEFRPDVIFMDVRMPEMDGLQATHLLKARWPQIKIVVLSMYLEHQDEALAAGADAFIGKGEPPDRLLASFAAVTAKED
jgi:DNA-binding NarL/FixJ family response regulator